MGRERLTRTSTTQRGGVKGLRNLIFTKSQRLSN